LKASFYFFFICLLFLVPSANGQNQINFTSMDEEIYQAPWKSFQKLMALESRYDSMPKQQKIWWLLRKAQCENLLYFFDDFNKTTEKAQALVSDTTPVEIKARLNYFSGMVWQRASEYKKSSTSLKLAMEQANSHNLIKIYLIAKQELAYTQSVTELFEASLKDIQEAYVKAFQLDDHFLLATIYESYGAIYGYMQQYEKSVDYYQKAIEGFEILGYQAHIAEAIYGLASSYRYWGRFREASDVFRLYREKISYTPNSKLSFYGTYGLGMTLAEQGACSEALTVIAQALTLNGLVDYNAELYKRKASCLIQQGHLDAAEQALKQAENIFISLPELLGTAWQLEVVKISGELAHARGEHEKGYILLNDYYQQYADLLIKNSSSRVVNVRSSMAIEHQEIEKALTVQRLKVDDLELQQSNTHQYYFIALLLTFILIVLAVITFQHKTNKKITTLSNTDPLSGLFNRRYIFECLGRLVHDSQEIKAQLAVLLIDIDDFKQVNDTYGHLVGDKVIEMIAAIGQATLRPKDVMGRIGGEEFLCILPITNLEQSRGIAERLVENISKQAIKNDEGGKTFVTISIGVAELSTEDIDGKTLYINADKALYQAKSKGKNSASTS